MNKSRECKGGVNGDCSRVHYALGFCSGHYQAFKKGLPTDYDVETKGKHNAVTECTVDGCNKPYRSLGMCQAHYSKARYQERKKTRV